MICKYEKVKYEDVALSKIFDYTNGDLRHAINILQTVAGIGTISSKNVDSVINISGRSRVGRSYKISNIR